MKKLIVFLLFIHIHIGQVFSQNATFEVSTFGDVTPEIQNAIDFTTDIWSQYLVSDVPIKIYILYTPVPGTLGISFPNSRKNFPAAPLADTWYPTSLANALSGERINPDENDMDIFINSSADWYFGTSGVPASGQFDFVSVLLHEIGHSLGILSIAKTVDSLGVFGELTHADFGNLPLSFDFPDLESQPGIFDRFIIDATGQNLTDETIFTNNSSELFDLLTGNGIFFGGENAYAAVNQLFRPRLYAPESFDIGSSATHLDEDFFNGTSNSCMTPFIAEREVIHNPGGIVIGMLKDIGWTISGPAMSVDIPNTIAQNRAFPSPFSNELTIEYNLQTSSDVSIKIYDVLGREVAIVLNEQQQAGKQQVRLNQEDLEGLTGMLFYEISAGTDRVLGKILKL